MCAGGPNARGARLRAGLAGLPGVVSVRGAGLLLAAQLEAPTAKEIAAAALEAGLLVNPVRPDAIRVAPPLLVSDAEIDAALAIMDGVMAAAAPAAGPGRRPDRTGGLRPCRTCSTWTTCGRTTTNGCSSWPRATPAPSGRCSPGSGWRSCSRSPRPAPGTPRRWRCSSWAAIRSTIQAAEVGLDTRESAEDIARTLGCYHRIICARVFDHDVLPRMAVALEGSNFDVPVVNLLSDEAHPCQAIADAITLRELLGPLPGQVLGYVGDSNNMCRSLVKMALIEGMDVRVASPTGYSFSAEEQDRLTALAERVGRGGKLLLTHDPEVAAGGADALYTDVWTSMGQEKETAERLAAFEGFMIDDALLDVAEPDVFVLHCLPAHRGRRSRPRSSRARTAWCGSRPPTARPPCGGSWPGPIEEPEPGEEPGA